MNNPTKSTNAISLAPRDEGHHAHKCIKCGVDYVHYHPHKTADHPQFAFQCPNLDCEWHFSKGTAFKPRLHSPLSGTGTDRTDTTKTETYAQRSVRMAYADGKITCNNDKHFIMKAIPGQQYKVCTVRPAAFLIEAMALGVPAKCSCERAACREAWTWNRPGVFETEWVQPGSLMKGFTKDAPQFPRRVMPLAFHLSKDQVTFLHEHHPGWVFVTTGTESHDHPVAHATSQVATYNLFHSLAKGKWIDLHGNPAHCERLNQEMKDKTFLAMCNVESTQDVVRKRTKWGPSENKDGSVRWIESALRDVRQNFGGTLASAQGLTSVHTLYYYHPSELANVISATKGKMMVAMMHRFKADTGKMNNGEQEWRRYSDASGASRIEQTNVLTNTKYDHADNERWFKNTSWSPYRGEAAAEHLDEEVALSWDINIAANGVFVFRISTCTVREALLDTTWRDECTAPPKKNSDAYIRAYCKAEITHPFSGTETINIPTQYQDLFAQLRLKMLGAKTRDTAKYVSHSQYVALKCAGVMREQKTVDDVQVVYDLAYASFWIDKELDRSQSAFFGKDFRTQILDVIIISLVSKNALAGLAEGLRSIRHRL